jgi:alpha-D-ribose 1-methylphosphonate 5-triphosphate synthase subunit PhnH
MIHGTLKLSRAIRYGIAVGCAVALALFSLNVEAKSNGGNGGGGNGGSHGGDHGQGGSHGGGNSGGGGKSGGSGNSGNGGGTNHTNGDQGKQDKKLTGNVQNQQAAVSKTNTTPSAGKLNGFLHASPAALANASPNSAIGKVAIGVRDALKAYADGSGSLQDVAKALASATNKPVTQQQVAAVIAKLVKYNPDTSLSKFTDGTLSSADVAKQVANQTNQIRSQKIAASAKKISGGSLNGFLHASPNALTHAAPNSAVGKVAVGVRDALQAYADGTGSLDDVAKALAAATNKPVTQQQVAAVIQKLSDNNQGTSLDKFRDGTISSTDVSKQLSDETNALR